jgi:hypothetical protein
MTPDLVTRRRIRGDRPAGWLDSFASVSRDDLRWLAVCRETFEAGDGLCRREARGGFFGVVTTFFEADFGVSDGFLACPF